jgi:hypothetical protein
VKRLIDICGVTLNIPIETAVGMIRLLLVSVCHTDEIGPAYDDVIETLIDSAVTQLTGSRKGSFLSSIRNFRIFMIRKSFFIP